RNRGQRDAAQGDPRARLVPVAHVRKSGDDATARTEVRFENVHAGGAGVGHQFTTVHGRQPEQLVPVAEVGAHTGPGEGTQFRLGGVRADEAAQVRFQLVDPAEAVPPRIV